MPSSKVALSPVSIPGTILSTEYPEDGSLSKFPSSIFATTRNVVIPSLLLVESESVVASTTYTLLA